MLSVVVVQALCRTLTHGAVVTDNGGTGMEREYIHPYRLYGLCICSVMKVAISLPSIGCVTSNSVHLSSTKVLRALFITLVYFNFFHL